MQSFLYFLLDSAAEFEIEGEGKIETRPETFKVNITDIISLSFSFILPQLQLPSFYS